MNALARDVCFTRETLEPSAKSISAEEIFRERCEARAILYEAAQLSLHEAVDELHADAERTGLVDMLGQDAVQAIIAEAFGRFDCGRDASPPREDSQNGQQKPGFSEARFRLPASTIMAAEYLVRLNDPKRLRAWLARHTAVECKAILRHIEDTGS
jgi:hypothetical protein